MAGTADRTLRAWGRGMVLFGRMIRFPHTVFALPFALAGLVFAYHLHPVPVSARTWFWVIVAMVGARTAAMAFNRLADAEIDARNPRTRLREIPRGAVGKPLTAALTLLAAGLFVFAAGMLNPLCLRLSPLALAIILFYSYTKRFTWACHFFLGLALAVAPVGGWLAVTGRAAAAPFLLGLGVLTWAAGFDIIYALQDEQFDRAQGIRSLPARFGRAAALRVAAGLHLATVIVLLSLYPRFDLSPAYVALVLGGGGLLVYEHLLVRGGSLKRLSTAFFDMNGLFSLTYLAAALAGVYL